jgi:hypothetical protein
LRFAIEEAGSVSRITIANRKSQIANSLNVEVLYFQRVFFDERATAFDVFAHEDAE